MNIIQKFRFSDFISWYLDIDALNNTQMLYTREKRERTPFVADHTNFKWAGVLEPIVLK